MALGTLALAIIAIFIPPLPVVLKRGCGGQFLLNILLVLLVWIPAVLHAWWILAENNQKEKNRRVASTPAGGHVRPSSRTNSRREEKIAHHGGPGGYAAPPAARQGYYPPQQPVHHQAPHAPPMQSGTHAYGRGGMGPRRY